MCECGNPQCDRIKSVINALVNHMQELLSQGILREDMTKDEERNAIKQHYPTVALRARCTVHQVEACHIYLETTVQMKALVERLKYTEMMAQLAQIMVNEAFAEEEQPQVQRPVNRVAGLH